MTEEDREKIERLNKLNERLEEAHRKMDEWAAEMNRAGAAADGNAVLRAAEGFSGVLGELGVNLMREVGSDQESAMRELRSDQESDQAGLMEEDADMRRMRAAFRLARRGEVIATAEFDPGIAFRLARRGEVIATAEFDPGIAPFTIEVRRVPVPVTNSKHFIVSLYRGQYVVTSFRYFWPGYTPERVRVSWACINRFTVTFDDKYEASCDWRWGAEATWTMTVPEGSQKPGLSPYFFTPRNPLPPGCPEIPLE